MSSNTGGNAAALKMTRRHQAMKAGEAMASPSTSESPHSKQATQLTFPCLIAAVRCLLKSVNSNTMIPVQMSCLPLPPACPFNLQSLRSIRLHLPLDSCLLHIWTISSFFV
jgi:hypothetical protein